MKKSLRWMVLLTICVALVVLCLSINVSAEDNDCKLLEAVLTKPKEGPLSAKILLKANNTCKLIVALYAENGRFLTFSQKNVSSSNEEQKIIVDLERPENIKGIYVQVYLLEDGSSRPMSKPITSRETVYALLYEDGTLVFQKTENNDFSHGDMVESWKIDMDGYRIVYYGENDFFDPDTPKTSTAPWIEQSDKIQRIEFIDRIHPYSTVGWFMNCDRLKEIVHLDRLDTSSLTDTSFMFFHSFDWQAEALDFAVLILQMSRT